MILLRVYGIVPLHPYQQRAHEKRARIAECQPPCPALYYPRLLLIAIS